MPTEIIETSAPCRIDMGGTLDISTFHYPLIRHAPCTFNMALDLRTRVRVSPYKKGRIRIASAGFESAEFESGRAPFDHPLGLMFAVADFFDADGVEIAITSTSPVKSALGGSSSAAVALAGALSRRAAGQEAKPMGKKQIAMLAHHIEMITAQAVCGIQDHLAAACGGVNAWYWRPYLGGRTFDRTTVVKKSDFERLEQSIVLAYCGEPHESLSINGRWAHQFISGSHRDTWKEIIRCTHGFIQAMTALNTNRAGEWMNRETHLRRRLTPEVLNDTGRMLVELAEKMRCGARFTGAGGGGCLWACGGRRSIDKLRGEWEKILADTAGAYLLDAGIDAKGLVYESP